MYFECSLPEQAPHWLDARVAKDFTLTMQRVRARMELLECALDVSGMKGETFAEHAKKLFEISPQQFDAMTAEDIAGFVTMIDDGSEAEDRMVWPNAITIADTAFVTTDEWESIRHIGIGGSDAAVVLGVSPYQTATNLYYSKVGTPAEGQDDAPGNWVFDRGHIMEQRVIDAFCSVTGAKVVPESRMFASKTHPNCTANIDAIIRFSDGRMFIFEAKTTIKNNWAAWASDKIPRQYVPQMRQYPAVLADDRIMGTYIGCLFTDDYVVGGVYVGSQYDPDKLVTRFVERDAAEELDLLEREEQWFADHIECNDVPPQTGDPLAELQVLKTYVPRAESKAAPKELLLAEVKSDIEEWERLKTEHSAAQKKASSLDDAKKSVAARLVEKLGSSPEAVIELDDNRFYEMKNSSRSRTSVNVEELNILIDVAAPHLSSDLVDKFRGCIVKNDDAFRVFSLKEKIKKTKVKPV